MLVDRVSVHLSSRLSRVTIRTVPLSVTCRQQVLPIIQAIASPAYADRFSPKAFEGLACRGKRERTVVSWTEGIEPLS